MALLRTLLHPDAEFSAVPAGGVLGIFNGRERPVKYEPESQSIKYFGLLGPQSECTVAAGSTVQGSPSSTMTGTFIYACVEVDAKAEQGAGLISPVARLSEGVGITVTDELVTVTLQDRLTNDEATEVWIYRTVDGDDWPILGRIGKVAAGTATFVDNNETPDFVNFPLLFLRGTPPNKAYAFKLKRRMFGWSSEPWTTDLSFTVGSDEAIFAGGDEIDESVIGAVVYPPEDDRGYLVTNFLAGSPGTVVFTPVYSGPGSPDSNTQECKICRPSGEIVWSEPDEYEDFPAANVRFAELSSSDPESGAASINGRGLFFTVQKTFVLDYDLFPNVGQGTLAEISTSIGCLANRTIHDCNGVLLWLSEGGIAASVGGAPRIISDEIAPEFDKILRDADGRSRKAFAVNWRSKRRYICFYPQAGDETGCSKAIVVDYKQIPGEPQFRFTLYEFDTEMTCGAVERHTVVSGDTTNYLEFPIFGDANGYVWSFGIGDADGPTTGTVSGSVSSSSTSPFTITDSSAAFDTSGIGLAGMIATIRRASDGSEQQRVVVTNTADTLSLALDPEWDVSEGDTYHVGGISAFYETSWSGLGMGDRPKTLDRLSTAFLPEEQGSLTLEFFKNFSSTAESMTNEGTTLDLTTASGHQSKLLSGREVFHTKVKWSNTAPNQPFKLRDALLETEADEA